jgi:hypothetical protein
MRSSPTCLRTLMGGTGAQAQEGHSRRESPRLARDFARPPDKQSDARGPRRGRKVCPECARTMRVDTGDTRTVEGGIDAELPGMPTDCPDAAQWSPPGRATQNLVPFGAWGFDSPSRHHTDAELASGPSPAPSPFADFSPTSRNGGGRGVSRRPRPAAARLAGIRARVDGPGPAYRIRWYQRTDRSAEATAKTRAAAENTAVISVSLRSITTRAFRRW